MLFMPSPIISARPAEFIWHDSAIARRRRCRHSARRISYGDYLRCGAIAKFSPVMGAVKQFAAEGGLVLGICNGFQILVEAGLLPGALIRNRGLKFICREVRLTRQRPIRHSPTRRTRASSFACPWRMAKAATSPTSARSMNWKPRIAWCFAISDNPNGSLRDIAGILN